MKIFEGKVISTKMQQTVTVNVERVIVHPIYKKRQRKLKKYHVHDTLGVKEGQMVKFVASKPFSKTKRWRVIEIVGEKSGIKRKTNKKVKAQRKNI
jgi:small subunit ribosomal protein S17